MKPLYSELTATQGALLDYVTTSLREVGFQPTYREIMDAFGWASTNAVHDHLQALIRKGKIERKGHRWRLLP